MIYALVTLYRPSDKVLDNIRRISSQVNYVYVLDNSPFINDVYKTLEKTEYIYNGENLGLSNAFNKILKEKDFDSDDFIIFFDQDSTISDFYIESLMSVFENGEKKLNIGALGPIIFDRNTNKTSMGKNIDDSLCEDISVVPRLITSSLLCRYESLKKIGYWDENIFLDWADFDLSYRFQVNQLKCCIANNIRLNHCLGDNNKSFLGREYPYYSPIREYYQVRDSLILIKKKTTPLKEKIGMLYVAFIRTWIHFFIFDKKRERCFFYFRAYCDFARKRFGEYDK